MAPVGEHQLVSLQGRCTSQELLLVVETVSLHRGQLVFVLLNDLLEGAIQVLLLLLQKLLLLIEVNRHGEVLSHSNYTLEKNKTQQQNNTLSQFRHQGREMTRVCLLAPRLCAKFTPG